MKRGAGLCFIGTSSGAHSCPDYNDEIILSTCLSESLRKHLLEELEEAFPDDVEAYRHIHATSDAASGNMPVLLGLAFHSHVYLY
uniref:Mediator complex subunit 10 n=1 Tax=Aegilops tauschii subsp. strangulata TaxID=200361 RepID=A0A453G7V4_AEGTS